MVTSRREKARRIVIVYVIVGAVFFLLYHFILRPADPDNPIINALFYVFLPAILAAAALVSDVVLEGLAKILNRVLKKDEEIQDEDAVS
jgi:hypothetical protein